MFTMLTFDITEKWMMTSMLKKMTFNDIKHKPIGSKASLLICKFWEVYQPL